MFRKGRKEDIIVSRLRAPEQIDPCKNKTLTKDAKQQDVTHMFI